MCCLPPASCFLPPDFCLLLDDGGRVRLKAHTGAWEVNRHQEVAQKVAAEDATLLEAAGLVDGVKVEDQGAPSSGAAESARWCVGSQSSPGSGAESRRRGCHSARSRWSR